MESDSFATPIDDRYFEDYVAGAKHCFGSVLVEQEEIIAFASRYDPQIFHTNPERARDTPFGGLIASGWMTAGLMMRLYCENYLSRNASLGSPGLDELRWPKPVRPGDRLTVRVTVKETIPSRSKLDRGVVKSLIEVFNQDGDIAMSVNAVNMLQRRFPGQPGEDRR